MSGAPLATTLEWLLGAATVVLVVAVCGGAVLVRRLLAEARARPRGADRDRHAQPRGARRDRGRDPAVDLEGRTLLANPTIER